MSETIGQTKKLLGVEVSGTKLHAVCLDKQTNSGDYDSQVLDQDQEVLPQLIEFIKKQQKKFGDFTKIGIAVSGLINRNTNRVVLSMRNPEHAEIDLADEIKRQTGFDVVLENDANSSAYGEFRLGAGKGNKDIFYVTLGKGVGGAIILDGKLWRGNSGFAGEFGHFVIDSEGTKLEDVASETGIVMRTKNRLQQDHTTSLLNFEELTVSDIVNEANNGDDFAVMMLERTGKFVGIGIASVINLLNIEKIVVGGEVMQAEGLILNPIIESAKKLSFEPCFSATEIVSDELGDKAASIGAALLSEI
jgi:predicted NBD/HSP70 family sugar kinase